MFVLLISPEYGLPVVVSRNDRSYPDYIMAGYKEIDTGTKAEMQDAAEEMLSDLYHPSLRFSA